MKKILFLLLICFIKLNAYEYNYLYIQDNGVILRSYLTNINERKKLSTYTIYTDVRDDALSYSLNYSPFNALKGNSSGYVSRETFDEWYKTDLIFLNDLYTSSNRNRNVFFNYLYNENRFSNANYIEYNNYELLYNSDGLAVESIVNGQWAGLYEDPGQSGNLFNEKGDLIYVNGVHASFFDRINEKLLRKFKINLESIFIKKIFYPLLVLIFACVILRSVIRMAFQAFLIRFYDKKISQLEKRREKIENA